MTELLPCLLLPVSEKNIILPSAAIAEILPFQKPSTIQDLPEWLIGILTWRGVHVPLVYLEKMNTHLAWNKGAVKEEEVEHKGLYIAIINRINRNKADNQSSNVNQYPFLAVMLNKVPKLYRVARDNIQLVAQKHEGDFRFMMEIKIQNEYAFVPDLTNMWKIIDALPPRLQWFRQIVL